ncbi:hypothetical protein [Paenibacillus sp. 2TAB19]|uniref:hypothetical protein n=1 Tax=Paenibacillus sp. 2TAB19 TaxID=3233003 RepID=UPI003F9DDEFA
MHADSQRGQPSFESALLEGIGAAARVGLKVVWFALTEICTWELCSELVIEL